MIRTYLDTGVLITAFCGENPDAVRRAFSILDDENRKFVISDALKLEILPKPTFNKQKEALEFYNHIFKSAEYVQMPENIISTAFELACKYGLGAMDAIHVVLANLANAEELITSEKNTKPICSVKEPKVISLHMLYA